ncbi:MAG: hypothetical protein [Caudoviricetes sp.]|nr:MAG: hypothetical protein [Caudoviricetes sp.]
MHFLNKVDKGNCVCIGIVIGLALGLFAWWFLT